jgi:hypothetical protein
MTKPASPFAGITLTDHTALAARGTDQQLFSPTAPHPPAPPASAHTAGVSIPQQATHLPRKEGSQEPRKVGTQKPGNPATFTSGAQAETRARLRFDITTPATEKNSYMFSEEELWALRDVETELERTYRTDVSKYNIVRLGLHMLLEDYRNDKHDSFLVRRLGFSKT